MNKYYGGLMFTGTLLCEREAVKNEDKTRNDLLLQQVLYFFCAC